MNSTMKISSCSSPYSSFIIEFDVPNHFQRIERGGDVEIAEGITTGFARGIPGASRRFEEARFGQIRNHRARGKKTLPLSRERLPDLFREKSGRNHDPSRAAQKYDPRFFISHEIADGRRRSARQDERVLETHRRRRGDSEKMSAPSI